MEYIAPLLLLAAALAGTCDAYPFLFVMNHAKSCVDLPTAALGSHGAAVLDS